MKAAALNLNQFNLFQEVMDGQNLVFWTSCSPGANGCDVFKVIPGRNQKNDDDKVCQA